MAQTYKQVPPLRFFISDKNNVFYLRLAIIASFFLSVFLFSACTAATSKRAMPVWPNNGIAQRDFYGSEMFVEKDEGKWRAWILSDTDKEYDEALDFFSGESYRVTLKYYENGYLSDEFIDQKGREHKVAKDTVHLHFDDPRPGGGVGTVSFSGDELYFGKRNSYCSPELTIVMGVDPESPSKKKLWRKIPLYRDKAAKNCPSGRWMSLIGTSLDLGDGTFLATTEFNVFRLRMSDLSPVGVAPDLHVVDAEKVEAIIKSAEGKAIEDPNAYLSSQLDLPTLETSSSEQKLP
jgi:hypothetical protein